MSVLWTEAEDDLLRDCVTHCQRGEEVVQLYQQRAEKYRPRHGILSRMAKLGIRAIRYDLWTDEQKEKLRAFWNEGQSASQCARSLKVIRPGTTRNAVIGQAHRMDLKPRKSPIRKRTPRVTTIYRGCEWILGEPSEGRYCDNARLAGKPYCFEHMKIAYVGKRFKSEKPSHGMIFPKRKAFV